MLTPRLGTGGKPPAENKNQQVAEEPPPPPEGKRERMAMPTPDPGAGACADTDDTMEKVGANRGCIDAYAGAITLRTYLKLYDQMQTYVDQLNAFMKSGVKPAKPIDSLTHTVVFVVTYGGSVTPGWTLLNVTTATSPFISAQGLRTHTLLITIGPDSENVANLATQQVVNILAPH